MPTSHGVKWKSVRLATIKDQRLFIQKLLGELRSEDPNAPLLWKITPYERLTIMARYMTILVSTTEKGELEKRLDEILAQQHELEQIMQNMPGMAGDDPGM